nr:membrane protein m160 [Mastomys natalensis cytomegalovirus 3]WEG69983.1 membrane protein m160 [Mastomys natalensis cytomegalovirus 3]WEG70123.1 membrane protein m160 [Mastomys natalensis cytomegalovirus 3]WEG70263.1 membrane protein m160 [Mastomys natalensis cytomegalovirus 3]WEG70403.1 membrane protein m160 [Mastomys natalensis cytomegalovirus 3]
MAILMKVFLVTSLVWWLREISATIEIVHDGISEGVLTLRCLWSSPPTGKYTSRDLIGSWHIKCYDTHSDTVLATFSVLGLTPLYPDVSGTSWGNTVSKRATLTSIVKVPMHCHGIVICAVDKEDAGIVVSALVDVSISHITSAHAYDTSLTCSPRRICDRYDIEWFLSELLIARRSFVYTSGHTIKVENATLPVRSDAVTWRGEVLWVNSSRLRPDSSDICFVCETFSCGLSDRSIVCTSTKSTLVSSVSPLPVITLLLTSFIIVAPKLF